MKDGTLAQLGNWIDVGRIADSDSRSATTSATSSPGWAAARSSRRFALGLVLSHRSSGVVNFAHAGDGHVHGAFAYFEFRETGDLVLPLHRPPGPGPPPRPPDLARRPAVAAVLAIVLGLSWSTGWCSGRCARRRPRHASCASLGLLLYLQEIVRLRFPVSGRHRVVTPRRSLRRGAGRLLGTTVTENRLILAGLVIVVAAVLGAIFRFTRFGLATRAAAGNEKGALLLGISPDRLGLRLLGRGLGAGRVRRHPHRAHRRAERHHHVAAGHPGPGRGPARRAGVLRHHDRRPASPSAWSSRSSSGWSVRPDTRWIPDWLPTTGLQQLVPVAGDHRRARLAGRRPPRPGGREPSRRLPPSPEPRHVTAWTVGLVEPGQRRACSPSARATATPDRVDGVRPADVVRRWSSPGSAARSRSPSWPSPASPGSRRSASPSTTCRSRSPSSWPRSSPRPSASSSATGHPRRGG